MKYLGVALLVVFWILCGYLDYGYNLGYFTHRFPCEDHRDFAMAMAIAGPLSLPASLEGPRHWLTTPYTVEQRWKAFRAEFPNLSREYFEESYN